MATGTRMGNLWMFDARRIEILRELLACDAAAGCDLRKCLKVKKALLSYHLGVLRDRGIVRERKQGRDKYYEIAPKKVAFVRKVMEVVG